MKSQSYLALLSLCTLQTLYSESISPIYRLQHTIQKQQIGRNSAGMVLSFLGGVAGGGAILFTAKTLQDGELYTEAAQDVAIYSIISTATTYGAYKAYPTYKKEKTSAAFAVGLIGYISLMHYLN